MHLSGGLPGCGHLTGTWHHTECPCGDTNWVAVCKGDVLVLLPGPHRCVNDVLPRPSVEIEFGDFTPLKCTKEVTPRACPINPSVSRELLGRRARGDGGRNQGFLVRSSGNTWR